MEESSSSHTVGAEYNLLAVLVKVPEINYDGVIINWLSQVSLI